MSSITEVVQTVKHPHARSEGEPEPVEPPPLAAAAPVVAPGTPLWDGKKEDSRLSRKLSRRRSSLMGSVRNSIGHPMQ